MKIRQNLCKYIFTLVFSLCLLTGCASVGYVGSDYNSANVRNIQTKEDFYFSTYKKTSSKENINMSVGLGKTPLVDVLVFYIEIANNSNAPYITSQKDYLITNAKGKTVEPINSNVYLNTYQAEQTSTYAGMQALSPMINNFATAMNNYQTNIVQNENVLRHNGQINLNDQISIIAENITRHSFSNTETIQPGERKYFYIFVQASEEDYPLELKYSDLTYTFGTSPKAQ